MDELMGPAFIEPAHIRVIAEQFKHRVEFTQILFGLSVAEVFEGVSVNVFQIAFGAMRYILWRMREFGTRFPNNVVDRLVADGALKTFVDGRLNRFPLLIGRKCVEPSALLLCRSRPRVNVNADGFEHVHENIIGENAYDCQKFNAAPAEPWVSNN